MSAIQPDEFAWQLLSKPHGILQAALHLNEKIMHFEEFILSKIMVITYYYENDYI